MYEDIQLLRDLNFSQCCFSWFGRFEGPFDGTHNALRSSPTVQNLAKDLVLAATWPWSKTRRCDIIRQTWRWMQVFLPGQYSDGPSLRRGYSFSVTSGVVASYPWAGSVPCSLPAVQVPILIEVCNSVMLPQGHSMLTDRCAFLHVAWFCPLSLSFKCCLYSGAARYSEWWHPPNHAV